MVTATLTRPTSIAPTISCEAKVSLVEKLDIGLLIPPREQKVTMQTMRRRAKRKKAIAKSTKSAPLVKVSSVPAENSGSTSGNSTRASEGAGRGRAHPDDATVAESSTVVMPRSPIPSDIQSEFSGDSAASNNSGSNSGRGAEGSGESLAGSKKSSADDREITATVELLKGGCLPGDLLPVRIRIEHNRRMKSMHGIIVTFYRQGRVDYAPPAHLFTNMSKEEAAKLEREDYYPRSRTGLGGLSLSSAGSCSVFRKDLSQTVAPLIIDPATLTANINTSVRVPEDVFPSIKGVPGGMISFRYHVEVVVDLGGKLAGQSSGTPQHLTRIASINLHGSNSGAVVSPYEGKNIGSWNPAIVDTDHLRREKGVISVTFEAIVGTTDTSRSRGKQVARPALAAQATSSRNIPQEREEPEYAWQDDYNGEGEWSGHQEAAAQQQYHQSLQGYYPPVVSPETSYYDFQGGHEPHAPIYVPPPPAMQDPTGLSEKERVRQAEQRLLPSQPAQQPPEPEAGPSSLLHQPSAPSPDLQQTPRLEAPALAPVVPAGPLGDDGVGEGPSAPTFADLPQVGPSGPMEDKLELERRRLMEEASAPPEVPEDYNNNNNNDGGGGSGAAFAGSSAPPPLPLNATTAGPSAPVADGFVDADDDGPSAPVLDHDGEHNYHGTAAAYGPRDPLHSIAGPSSSSAPPAGAHHHVHGHEPLPRYER
ncbi:ph-response sensor protein [Diatrype stigma]|uniref:Ph-response sensor protein n=1 Tax=Diatrype stigma TaxID=117547 RepID=A0AAN9YRZ3_9PEZI